MPLFNSRWFIALLGVALFACLFAALNVTFRPPAPAAPSPNASLAEARASFAKVVVGTTVVPDLAKLGFDATRPGVQTLSYLGVMERFMPRTAADFDKLDPSVRDCLDAQGHCTAYIFPLDHARVAYDLFGSSAHAAAVAAPRITFLIRGGRVAYKQLSLG